MFLLDLYLKPSEKKAAHNPQCTQSIQQTVYGPIEKCRLFSLDALVCGLITFPIDSKRIVV